MSSIPGCGMAVCTVIIEIVGSARVFSGAGVVAMGTVGVTMLHPWGLGGFGASPFARGGTAFIGGIL
jgi:hypothetical protein